MLRGPSRRLDRPLPAAAATAIAAAVPLAKTACARSGHFLQASAGTLLIFLISWPPQSWDALSWDVTLGNPTLAMVRTERHLGLPLGGKPWRGLAALQAAHCAAPTNLPHAPLHPHVQLLFNMCLLLSQGTGLAAVQTAAEMVLGSLVGGGFGIAGEREGPAKQSSSAHKPPGCVTGSHHGHAGRELTSAKCGACSELHRAGGRGRSVRAVCGARRLPHVPGERGFAPMEGWCMRRNCVAPRTQPITTQLPLLLAALSVCGATS